MGSVFESYIRRRIEINDSELDSIRRSFTSVPYKKRDIVHRLNQPCNHLWFVEKGCFRMFNEDEKGNEFTFLFAMEEWWMGSRGNEDLDYVFPYHIECLEDGILLQISTQDLRELFSQVPSFREMCERLQQKNHNKMQERLQVPLSFSAEEKYAHLMANYPSLINRVPLGMIASYLGISRETLSRIRSSFRTAG